MAKVTVTYPDEMPGFFKRGDLVESLEEYNEGSVYLLTSGFREKNKSYEGVRIYSGRDDRSVGTSVSLVSKRGAYKLFEGTIEISN